MWDNAIRKEIDKHSGNLVYNLWSPSHWNNITKCWEAIRRIAGDISEDATNIEMYVIGAQLFIHMTFYLIQYPFSN